MSEFREKKLAALQAERTDTPEPEPVELVEEAAEVEQDVQAAQEVELDAVEELPEGEQSELDDGDAPIEGEGDVDVETSAELVAQLKTEITESLQAESDERFKSMQADYTRKTQAIAETLQKLEEGIEDNEVRAQFYGNIADNRLQPYQNADWKNMPPEQYQQNRQGFQQAQHEAEYMRNEESKLLAVSREKRDDAKKRQAAIGADVLKTKVPNWGPQRFSQLQEHAVNNLSYSAQEVAGITDWRHMALIEDSLNVSEKSAAVKTLKRDGKAAPKGTRTKTVAPLKRNAKGQYQKAKEAAFEHPGDRSSFREMKLAALKAERG